jgi:DNA-binding LytR/AlgR family response regulator
LALPVAAALFLTLTGAFGLDVLPIGERFAYWLVLLCLGQGANLFLRARLPASGGRATALSVVMHCLGSAVPISLVVWATTALALSEPLRVGRLADFYVAVLVITTAMYALNYLAYRRSVSAGAARPQTAPAVAALRARLPDKLKTAPILALEAEDHYVRVHTGAGSDLVLLRFADAIAEMGGTAGARVHRSWWVARDAVESSHVIEDKRVLVLAGGIEAPVSRAYAKALRGAGWFV